MGRNRDEKFRAGTCGPELQLLRTRGGLMKAHGAPGRTCSRLGAWARARLASRRRRSLPCRQRAAAAAAAQPQHATRRPPEHQGLARRAAALSGLRVPALTVARRFPAPPAGGNKLITIIPAQSSFFLDVNHSGAGITRLKGVHGGGVKWERRKEDLRRGWG